MNMIFGMTAANFGMHVRFGLRIIVKCLNKHKDAMIKFQMFQSFKTLHPVSKLNIQIPDLNDVWFTMDGLKSPI